MRLDPLSVALHEVSPAPALAPCGSVLPRCCTGLTPPRTGSSLIALAEPSPPLAGLHILPPASSGCSAGAPAVPGAASPRSLPVLPHWRAQPECPAHSICFGPCYSRGQSRRYFSAVIGSRQPAPFIRSQAFEVPDYLISPLQMYVTPLLTSLGGSRRNSAAQPSPE